MSASMHKSVASGAPAMVANLSTAIPNATGNFTSFKSLSLDPTDASNLVEGHSAERGESALKRVAADDVNLHFMAATGLLVRADIIEIIGTCL